MKKKKTELNVLFQAANIIRNLVLKSKPWNFEGSIPKDLSGAIPNEINCFFKWCIGGKKVISSEKIAKHEEVERRPSHMSQILIANRLSRRQVESK